MLVFNVVIIKRLFDFAYNSSKRFHILCGEFVLPT